MVVFMSFLIFFDDYTSILIAGNSMRKVQVTTPTSVCVSPCTHQVMQTAGVSKDKFAFIVQSMAPSMASFVPISRLAIEQLIIIAFLLCHQLGWCPDWLCLLRAGRLYCEGGSVHHSCQDPAYVHTHCCCPYLLFLSPHCRVPFLAHTDGSVCGHSVRPQSRLWTNADGREEDIEKHSNNHC